MDQSQEDVEETTKSVNPMNLDPSVSVPFEPARSEHVSIEALLKISQDMTRVLDQLTTTRAPIDSIRKYEVEEFHGTSLEESDKTEFWLEKSEIMSQERNPERKFSRGGPSSSKRTRGSQVESVHSSTTRGRR